MENKYIEPLKWWDNLPSNEVNDLMVKYRNSGLPEFDNKTEEFYKLNDWDRIVIIYEKENPTPASEQGEKDGTIIQFLHGSHSFQGVWFGCKHPTLKGDYWWRKFLPPPLPSGQQTDERTINKELFDFLISPNKPIKINDLKNILNEYDKEEISFSRFAEKLNEIVYYWNKSKT